MQQGITNWIQKDTMRRFNMCNQSPKRKGNKYEAKQYLKIHGYNFPKFRKDIKLQINKALLTLSRIN